MVVEEVPPGGGQSVPQAVRRAVADGLGAAGDVDDHRRHLTTRCGDVLGGDGPTGDLANRVDQLEDGHGATRADDGPAHVSTVPREFDAPYDVVDEHQVTPLFAVAVDLDPAVVQRRPHEPGHEAVLVAHAGPVDVGEPQRTRGHAVGARVTGQQHLARRLGGAVGGERPQRRVLGDGRGAHVTDHGVGGRHEEPGHAVYPRQFQQLMGDGHVLGVRLRGHLHRAQHGRHGGEMDDPVDPGHHGTLPHLGVGQLPLDGDDPRIVDRQRFPVHDRHSRTTAPERGDDRASDEAAASRDHDVEWVWISGCHGVKLPPAPGSPIHPCNQSVTVCVRSGDSGTSRERDEQHADPRQRRTRHGAEHDPSHYRHGSAQPQRRGETTGHHGRGEHRDPARGLGDE